MRELTYVKLLRRLAEGGVVLLYKVPSNLILRKVAVAVGIAAGGFRGCRSGWILLSRAAILILLAEVSVGCCHRIESVAEMRMTFPVNLTEKCRE